MFDFFLMQANACSSGTAGSTICACTYGGINQGDWLNINFIIVLFVFMLAALIYSLSSLFPTSMRERLKGAVRYEMVQSVLSIVIIGILLGFAVFSCQLGQQMVGSVVGYQNPIQYSQVYLGQLLFQRSTSLFTEVYSYTVALTTWGNVLDELETTVTLYSNDLFGFELNPGLVGIYYGFSSVLNYTFSAMIAITFGVVFIYYALLPLISSIGLPVLVPLSIAMRCIPFAGPRLREASDSFLAIAIALNFIFPLTLLLNHMIIGWLYTPCTTAAVPVCNPNEQFLHAVPLNNVPTSSLFSSDTVPTLSGVPFIGSLSLPFSYFGGAVGGLGGPVTAIVQGFNTLLDLPLVLLNIGQNLAEYLFETIVLLALDTAITIGFAQGLTKALGSVTRLMAVGPVWGN